jgi:hypothetical protein
MNENNHSFGYTVLIILNLCTIIGSSWGLYTKGVYFILPLSIGIICLYMAIKFKNN